MTLEEKIKEFIEYRKSIKKPIREASKEAFLEKLTNLSKGNERVAIAILHRSIAMSWQGIFELPIKEEREILNGKQATSNNEKTDLDSLNSAAERVLQQFANGFDQRDTNEQSPGDWGYKDAG